MSQHEYFCSKYFHSIKLLFSQLFFFRFFFRSLSNFVSLFSRHFNTREGYSCTPCLVFVVFESKVLTDGQALGWHCYDELGLTGLVTVRVSAAELISFEVGTHTDNT